jgi:hypothetical protein
VAVQAGSVVVAVAVDSVAVGRFNPCCFEGVTFSNSSQRTERGDISQQGKGSSVDEPFFIDFWQAESV